VGGKSRNITNKVGREEGEGEEGTSPREIVNIVINLRRGKIAHWCCFILRRGRSDYCTLQRGKREMVLVWSAMTVRLSSNWGGGEV